jgi:peptidoglycan/xylan/chitin deacetylase (PgdA/CDA1 family)
VVFVTSGAIGSSLTLWKDAAACLWRANQSLRDAYRTIGALVEWLSQRTPAERESWLREAIAKSPRPLEPMMMSASDLRRIQGEGAAIGGHGATHTSLTDVADIDAEASRCRRDLAEIMGAAPTAFAFPNGRYNATAIAAVARAGFSIQFSSEPHLNKWPVQGDTPLFGRIDMPEAAVVDERGGFDEERLAYWLAMRPVRAIGSRLTA